MIREKDKQGYVSKIMDDVFYDWDETEIVEDKDARTSLERFNKRFDYWRRFCEPVHSKWNNNHGFEYKLKDGEWVFTDQFRRECFLQSLLEDRKLIPTRWW